MRCDTDVLDLILEHCDNESLRAASLTCRFVRDRAQKRLFSKVELRGLKHCYVFLEALTDRLAVFVRDLSVIICRCATSYHDMLHALVARCTRLESLQLENADLDVLSLVMLTELRSLNLIGAGVLTDFCNSLSMTRLPLTRLAATRLFCIPNLSAIFEASPKLTALSIGPMANVSLAVFTISLRNAISTLEELTVDGWDSYPLGTYGTARPQAERLIKMLAQATKLRSLTIHLHCLHDLLPPLMDALPDQLETLHIDTTSFPAEMDSLNTFFQRLATLPKLRKVVLEGYTSDAWSQRMDEPVKGWSTEKTTVPCSSLQLMRT